MIRRAAEGSPEPLGVSSRDGGVNVAVFSAHAERIEFCLFDDSGAREVARLPLSGRSGDVHHAFFADVPPGSRYGLRAYGPYDPARGHRFNSNKLLVDPFATVLDRRFTLHPSLFAYADADGGGYSDSDSAPHVPKAVVTAAGHKNVAGERLATRWRDTILYELNVRAFTMRHAAVPAAARGTLAGLADPAVIRHLKTLGVTAVEVMPAAAWIDERHLPPLGLTNAWGYNPVALLAPEPKLAPGGWAEVRSTIAALHDAGIEIILDVVLNHTGEGDERGPTLSFRGLDNASYYRLRPDDPARYIDDMGCGNCLALDRPHLVRLCMDALRTWAFAGVDGFRFDLATAMGRRPDGFDADAPLIAAIRQDPALRDLKLIAEAWDIGPGGYQVGRFPAAFAEWNDRYRDSARRFWRGDAGAHREMATRLAGSSDLFAGKGRPSASINFITAHDGFTLADLVSHAEKHNEANGEAGRDGANDNLSWNNGVEGDSEDSGVRERRRRDQINLLATLIFSRGTPMLAMGGEFGHSQGGNNNAYAQDNATTWLDWSGGDSVIFAALSALVAARRDVAALHDDRFLSGHDRTLDGFVDARWLRPDGEPANDADWQGEGATLLLALASDGEKDTQRAVLALHRREAGQAIVLPPPRAGHAWRRTVDTASAPQDWGRREAGVAVALAARSVAVFVETPDGGAGARTAAPTDALVDALAEAAGICRDWWDHGGARHIVTPETKRTLLASMGFDTGSAAACRDAIRHLRDLRVNAPPPRPGACWTPEPDAPGFGVAAQLYTLRRAGDQGVGDLTTLALAAAEAARQGAAAFGVNPLHALFPQERLRASPYHPSDRRFLDDIYIDLQRVALMPGGESVARLLSDNAAMLEALRTPRDIDYTAVAAFKRRALRDYFAGYQSDAAEASLAGLRDAFETFCAASGAALDAFATFRALQSHQDGGDWRRWPGGLSDASSIAVRDLAAARREDIRFECFLQWLADLQLSEAAGGARTAGLRQGLYRDLAVGCAPDGAEIWSNRRAYATGVSVGAPPDPFSADGQVWNLPPLTPHSFLEDGFAFFRQLISANMRHAGLLRIDHVMGLTRLFWVPDGARAQDGAYVAYPLQALLGVVAEESRARRCAVVGEDLGTVPDGFREALSARGVLSYRVLWFERNGRDFLAPETYPSLAVACVSTHDLPTLAGWWSGDDLAEKARLGLVPDLVAAKAERAAEKAALTDLLLRRGDIDAGPDLAAPLTDSCAAALHRLVSAAPSRLAFVQADDLAGETVAVNLPGTDRERPNWRRRLAEPVETLFETSRAHAVLSALRARR